MSRVGKKTISIPENVTVEIKDSEVTVKGPKGELTRVFRPEVGIKIEDNSIIVFPKVESKKARGFWGLTRVLLSNMVEGTINGYQKKLQIEGVGYKAEKEGEDLVLRVGFSHPVKFKKPGGIDFSIEKNIITVEGIEKEKVGLIAAKIRKTKPPEPYKGKGIRYEGEIIRRKAGKKAISSS